MLVVHKKDHLKKLEEGLRLAESFAGDDTGLLQTSSLACMPRLSFQSAHPSNESAHA